MKIYPAVMGASHFGELALLRRLKPLLCRSLDNAFSKMGCSRRYRI
ncbi:MAG: hypothetical protein F6K41_19780 [Symploca sp. SIO3E6]|nr:hypothetical protein [Caldora sp. SIO3E6]